MLPYIDLPSLHIWGPFALEPFGTLVVLGCLAGYFAGRRHAVAVGLDAAAYDRLVAWVLVPGFIVSNWTSLALYHPAELATLVSRNPLELVNVFSTMSSYGGLVGAALGALVFVRRERTRGWGYADAAALGWLVGWFFGRLGCTIVHDHPGVRSDFILAVQFPDGPRHDLGLYEWWFTIALLAFVLWVRKKRPADGTILAIIAVGYAPPRFFLDFLRADDPRYAGWTPGQYFSLALLIIGFWILAKTARAGSRRASQGSRAGSA